MKVRSLALTGAVLLATVTAAAAQTRQPDTAKLGGQTAAVAAQEPAASRGRDWFISPTDPRYQENGAPRVGEVPDRNTAYAGIHGSD